jgi:hypothetical protein
MGNLKLHPSRYSNEHLLTEKLITEAIDIHSVEMIYIPRQLVAEDKILGEDRLSEFKSAYPINVYLENVDGFEGQQAFASKFGLQMEQSATLQIARRKWNQLVGQHKDSVLPNRPSEGDLLYFPMTKGLFEILHVIHQQPFYQLGQLYVYKLTVELFRYASERIDTGVADIDSFVGLKSTDITVNPVVDDTMVGENKEFQERKNEFVFDRNNPFGDI